MSIDREESLFLTVSEDHSQRPIPEFVKTMGEPVRQLGGMAAAYEGVVLGGADKIFGLDELNLWLRRYRFAAYDMELLLPIAHMCLEYAVRLRIREERPGIQTMAQQAARELLETDPLNLRVTSRNWMYIYWMVRQFPQAADPESLRILRHLSGFDTMVELFVQLTEASARCENARDLVEQAVLLYHKIFTRFFAPDHDKDPVPDNHETPDPMAQPLDEGEPPEPDPAQAELSYEKAGAVLTDGIELPEDALAAGAHLQMLGIALIFICIMILTNAILQTYGKEKLPIFTVIVGGVVNVVMNYILVGNPDINIHGAPVSTLCCYMVIAGLNLFFVWKYTPEKPRYFTIFAKPVAASLLMGGAAWAVYGLASRVLDGAFLALAQQMFADPDKIQLWSVYLANAACVLLGILAGVIVYGVLVIALRILRAEDVRSIPRGEKLIKLLHLK